MTTLKRGDLTDTLDRTSTRTGLRGFTFVDLVRATAQERASLSQVAAWLAAARSSGAVEDLGFDPGVGGRAIGPRRYRTAQRQPDGHGVG